jgi:hypothetical protein
LGLVLVSKTSAAATAQTLSNNPAAYFSGSDNDLIPRLVSQRRTIQLPSFCLPTRFQTSRQRCALGLTVLFYVEALSRRQDISEYYYNWYMLSLPMLSQFRQDIVS